MKLYHLETLEGYDYDEADAYVVCANSPKEARALAEDAGGRFTLGRWSDPKRSSCKELKPGVKSCVIIESFNAG